LLRVIRVGVPVISVGNIVTGGVGKTPLVQFVAGYCSDKGKRVGVVSRGYKRRTSGVVDVSRGQGPIVGPDLGGDEAVQLASALPGLIVVVAERRVDAARRAVSLGAEVVIADDGFQHRYLARDLNILVLDAERNLTREALLPAGMLREPLSSWRRADVLILSHDDAKEIPAWIEAMIGGSNITLAGFRFRTLPMRGGAADGGSGQPSPQAGKLLAFSGIGNHERFLGTVRSAGYTLGADIRFGDHHHYSAGDFRRIGSHMKETGCIGCVTTEKDIARIDRNNAAAERFLREQNVSYIPVSIEFTRGESLFLRQVDDCLGKKNH
jgi:tetraacyldisaccharide 4'-kinase